MEDVIELARRRGFLWPSYEIYGGASGFYDYGPLGAALKNRVEDLWRRFFVIGEGYMEISSPAIGVEEVFRASGHVSHFVDPIVTCEKCGEGFRADHLLKEKGVDTDGMTYEELDEELSKRKVRCPACGGGLSRINTFNLMFKTGIGAAGRTGYLRPETAQNIFILFNRLYEFYRKKLPFGVAQLGRAYRNEISPRQGLLRLREFSQAEAEVFVDPGSKDRHPRFPEVSHVKLRLLPGDGEPRELTAAEMVEKGIVAHQYLAYHMVRTYQFLREAGIPVERIRFRQHRKTEMAHYACDCWDAEVLTERYGWVEVVGIADRTDYDLRSHIRESGVDLKAFLRFDTPKREKRVILEPDMKRLGPVYKDKAKEVGELIRASDPGKVKGDGSIDIVVEGERLNIEKGMFSKKTVEERVEGEKIIPHVIEPSFGIDRIIYCILESARTTEERNGEERTVLRLKPAIAPYDVAVFSLVSKEGLDEKAFEVFEMLREKGFLALYDTSGTIGRRYARADEIGVPYAVTVDFQTLEDDTVTIRDRDTMKQERVKIADLAERL
ncbi:MAG: glycine--tRNA ligase [Methanobacteriota archaeon]|nr:MAG: glycine--tRNA ligase [Euryarchaeota archaeon]